VFVVSCFLLLLSRFRYLGLNTADYTMCNSQFGTSPCDLFRVRVSMQEYRMHNYWFRKECARCEQPRSVIFFCEATVHATSCCKSKRTYQSCEQVTRFGNCSFWWGLLRGGSVRLNLLLLFLSPFFSDKPLAWAGRWAVPSNVECSMQKFDPVNAGSHRYVRRHVWKWISKARNE
jgi:hypothetical protein